MLAAFLLLIVGLLVLWLYVMVAIAKQRIDAHGLPLLIIRYLTGMPHHGNHLTDAGWSRPGTRALTPTGHVGRFWYLPRRKRAARRSARAFVTVATLWGLLFHLTATLVMWAIAVVAGAAYGIWRVRRWWLGRKHHRTWVYPLHLTAAPLLGIPLTTDPGDWLTIEPDRSRVVAILPPEYNPDDKQKQRLVQTLSTKAAMEAPEVKWQLAGPRPMLELTASQPPPTVVTLDDVMPAIEAAKRDEVVWGLGKKRKVVTSSLSGDSPHIGLSMGSGAGKSRTARALLAQMLYHGAIGLVLDYKKISHHWARNLPNVVIARSAAEIHAALMWLARELERRNDVALAGADDEGDVHATVGPRIIVICEELNGTMGALRKYWRDARDRDDPARSPALDALDAVSFMGRQVKCNLVYIGQRLSVKAAGGDGDARENIGVIAFSRYSPSNWKMLAGDHPMPPKSLTPGRLQVVARDVCETQAVNMSAAEAQKLAVAGTVSALPSTMPGAPRETRESIPVLALKIGPDLGVEQVHPDISPSPVSGVTLSAAHAAGVFGPLKLAGVRTARFRDRNFPQPVGRHGPAHLYDPEALASWALEREE